MVVVDLGAGLAGVGAQDASGVLDEPSLGSDRCGEKERVQHRAVESFADVGAGSDDEQRRTIGCRLQTRKRAATGLGAHPAAQHDRVVTVLDQGRGEPI